MSVTQVRGRYFLKKTRPGDDTVGGEVKRWLRVQRYYRESGIDRQQQI